MRRTPWRRQWLQQPKPTRPRSRFSAWSHPFWGSHWWPPGPGQEGRTGRTPPPGLTLPRNRTYERSHHASLPAAAAYTPRPWQGQSNRRCRAPPHPHPVRGQGNLRCRSDSSAPLRIRSRSHQAAVPGRRLTAQLRYADPTTAASGQRRAQQEYPQ